MHSIDCFKCFQISCMHDFSFDSCMHDFFIWFNAWLCCGKCTNYKLMHVGFLLLFRRGSSSIPQPFLLQDIHLNNLESLGLRALYQIYRVHDNIIISKAVKVDLAKWLDHSSLLIHISLIIVYVAQLLYLILSACWRSGHGPTDYYVSKAATHYCKFLFFQYGRLDLLNTCTIV